MTSTHSSGLEKLPTKLQRNFNLMRDLDTKSKNIMESINKKTCDFIEKMKGKDSEDDNKYKLFKEIHNIFNIQNIQTNDLPKDGKESNFDVCEDEMEHSPGDIAVKKGRKRGKDKRSVTIRKRAASSEKEQRENDSQKANKKQKKTVPEISNNAADLGALDSDDFNIPIDPNEPRYCLCNQVSYGEMIGCDNLECEFEWFHFACMGLTTKPKGKWFCPKCKKNRKKKVK